MCKDELNVKCLTTNMRIYRFTEKAKYRLYKYVFFFENFRFLMSSKNRIIQYHLKATL